MREIIIIAHNIRSTHNVGALFRTADGLGIGHIICSGYTPFPNITGDPRLPHVAQKVSAAIHKTALGAETHVKFSCATSPPIKELKLEGFEIVGLEQNEVSIPLDDYRPTQKIALLLGEEVEGISSELLALCDDIIEIPMYGKKESFNVSVAAGIALYHLRHK